jgi:iron complex outermembrane receptor protein
VNYADTDQTGRPQKCVPLPGIIGWQAELFDFIQVEPSTGRTYDDFCQDAADVGDERDVISDLGGNYEAENKGVSLTAEWEINDNLSLKSISAWRNTDAAQDDELDHTGIPWLHRTQTVHPDSTNRETDQYSQEFQLTGSAFDDRMQYVSGVYWFSETTDDNRAVNFLGPFDPGIGGLFMLNSTSSLLEAENDAWAVFTQVEWAYNDNWRSTVGVRYTDEDRELEKTEYAIDPSTLDANGGFVIPAFNGAWIVDRSVFEYNPGFGFLTEEKHKNDVGDDDTTFMASVQYLIDQSGWVDTGTVYLTYSQGFRSGGISEDDLSVFDPETVDNVEFGFKLDMLDRRLRVNGAVFYSAYDDRQLTTLVINPATNSPQGATINAEESTIAGIELETIWLATPNLELTFNATFNDGDIDDYEDVQISALPPGQGADPGCEFTDLTLIQIQTCPNDRSDENLPRLPEATYFFAAQYNWQTQWGAFLPRIQLSYKEDVEYCFDSTSCRLDLWNEDEQFDLSARVTWASNDGKWVGAIYGSNLTDEDYIIGGSALTENAGVGGFVANPPRMYGAELKYSF